MLITVIIIEIIIIFFGVATYRSCCLKKGKKPVLTTGKKEINWNRGVPIPHFQLTFENPIPGFDKFFEKEVGHE